MADAINNQTPFVSGNKTTEGRSGTTSNIPEPGVNTFELTPLTDSNNEKREGITHKATIENFFDSADESNPNIDPRSLQIIDKENGQVLIQNQINEESQINCKRFQC